ncbi:hypothetical protein CAMGR0001_1342 [Campylobacter gracilis RM3268]|uniref:Uncharacterized protein n=1 Tax=Campylobacter gracilis RM3268 TaxID=553220 RepID=C8PJE2_9BACT|nr:hypothetical protein CAMGR0001_1342 [Campylobacter gracilis RM3268]
MKKTCYDLKFTITTKCRACCKRTSRRYRSASGFYPPNSVAR